MTSEDNNKEENNHKEDDAEIQNDVLVETQHTVTIDGVEIAYTVTCGTIVLKEESEKKGEQEGEAEGEKPKATIFFIAYTRDDVQDKNTRPVTFSFNGGPGSSSVWLHLGVLGPRRVVMGDAGDLLPPPYKLEDNAFSLLDESDLVFIDPVGTGYSRAVPGERAKQFFSFKKDIESVGDFIRLYLSRYKRWNAPKFLIGESYGTTRAAGLSGYLQERHGVFLNGIMLISSILNFQNNRFDQGNDLPYILILPTYAATAWYHKRLPDDLQADLRSALDEAQAFAGGEYSQALMKGAALPPNERKDIVSKLSRYTGLASEFIERCDLRVELSRFTKELLRDEARTVGRLDSRFKGIDRDSAGEHIEHDPSMSATMGPYTATFNQYVRAELEFESDLPYEILNFNTNRAWSFNDHENRYVNVAETLRKAMTINPHLKVFVGSGFYDMATPYFASEYTFNHLGLDPSRQENVSMDYYEAGHMMYVHMPSLEKMKGDLVAFIRDALS